MKRKESSETKYQLIHSVLKELQLEHLIEIFQEQGITDEVVADLMDSDLKELGVQKLGERKRILRAFATLNASQTEESQPEVDQSNQRDAIKGEDAAKTAVEVVNKRANAEAEKWMTSALKYHNGDGNQDPSKALPLFRRAADTGLAEAQNMVGLYYFEGWGVERDQDEANQWFEKAASTGLPIAQYNLGKNHFFGVGIARNEQMALQWLERAALHNLAVAQTFLGHVQRVANNWEAAFGWFQKAAQRGSAEAQFELGMLYYSGLGCHENLEAALKWWSRAEKQGFETTDDPIKGGGRAYRGERTTILIRKGVPLSTWLTNMRKNLEGGT